MKRIATVHKFIVQTSIKGLIRSQKQLTVPPNDAQQHYL